ncbi:MAG: phosphatidylserine/phosphatidylglycerophosphate/cardiolipin synthase family protein [Cyanobacteria bacterium J06638_28]
MGVFFWVVAIALAILILIFFGHLYLGGNFRRQGAYRLVGLPSSAPHFLATVASMSDSLMTEGAIARFWSDIDRIQTARLQLISQAQELIQFETFMMTPGERSAKFATLLKQKAAEGVTVQVLADSYGAHSLPATYWRQLQNAGVEVRFFNPFSKRAPLDFLRRNHRKLLVVDQQIAMVGGAGIADCWDGKDQYAGETPWYDFEVELRGKVVGLLTGFFWQHWLSEGGTVDLQNHLPERAHRSESVPVLITPGEDPSMGDSPIRSLLHLCIASAQQRLWIASPYLLPDKATCQMLTDAHEHGVDVRILTMGPKSDKPYVCYVSRERYGLLLQQGIKVHEYQPSMMHAKIILIDDRWVSFGSANLDPRSFFHNDELNICTSAPALVQDVHEFFQQGFGESCLIQPDHWQKRPLKQKLMGRLGNLFYWQL